MAKYLLILKFKNMKNKIILIIVILLQGVMVLYSQEQTGQTIITAEYYVGTDPGEGNGTPISGSFPSTNVTLTLNNLSYPQGTVLYFRVQSSDSTWSNPLGYKVDKNKVPGGQLAYGEYFINTDPGQGNATPLSFDVNGIATVSNLTMYYGDVIYIRTEDTYNRWSNPRGYKYLYKDIMKAQYKIKLASNGQFTNPANTTVTENPDHTGEFIGTKNNITWHTNDSIWTRMQTYEGFYSQSWILGIVANAGVNQIICEGEEATLTATGGSSYQWSDGQAGATITVTPDTTTTYGLTASHNVIAISLDSVTVYVLPQPATPTITQNGNTLISSSAVTYQWYNMSGPISGATSQTYNPPATGNYYVVITDVNGCSATLDNFFFILSGVADIGILNNITIYPNPTTGELFIEMEITKAQDLELKLLNVVGQVIYEEKLNKYVGNYQKVIDVGVYAKGVYTLQLLSDEGVINRKVVVE